MEKAQETMQKNTQDVDILYDLWHTDKEREAQSYGKIHTSIFYHKQLEEQKFKRKDLREKLEPIDKMY